MRKLKIKIGARSFSIRLLFSRESYERYTHTQININNRLYEEREVFLWFLGGLLTINYIKPSNLATFVEDRILAYPPNNKFGLDLDKLGEERAEEEGMDINQYYEAITGRIYEN